MIWGVALNVRNTLADTLQKAEVADQGGIDQVWVTDFPAVRYAPAVAAAIAQRTSQCRIGVGLVSPLLYSVTQIVQFMSTLIDNYGNRFDLLLGPGDRYALANIGVSIPPMLVVEKTKKALGEIKSELASAGYRSSVLFGAQGPSMLRVSLNADGVLLNYSDNEMVSWALNQITKRTPKDFQLGIFPPTFVGDCEDIEKNQGVAASAAMVAIGLSKAVSELFNLHDKISIARGLLRKRGRVDSDIIRTLGKEILQRFAFCGTTEQLIDYLKALEELNISSVVFGPPQGTRKNGVDVLVEAKSRI
ncbi:MAG: LLM class flavin-dependent oxidoreductase [Candidatus Thorarchaeota archaeon]